MTNVSGHGRNIARLHDDFGTGCTGILVFNFPFNFITKLNEPFNAIIAVLDGQNVFLGGGTAQAAFQHR